MGSTTDLRRPVFARYYARLAPRLEDEGLADLRRELLAGLRGDVIEVGAGSGLNFRHYPASVTSVSAVEPEPYLRRTAEDAAGETETNVTVLPGTAGQLPLPDASCDAAVLCLVMCSLDDRPAALAEIARVLRPGGVLRFLEHTRATTRGLRVAQRIADATIWPLMAGGCHTSTDPVGDIEAAGYTVTECRALRFPDVRISQPSTPHVLGSALAPHRS